MEDCVDGGVVGVCDSHIVMVKSKQNEVEKHKERKTQGETET